ncbi:hypothetical protein DL96DRAFT_1719127 [Flagelloscypha sp. PMI_526]|nr:hypothetical protein DL96DRAFT_1719127 [Flagelloscypha sp. PMI_526]
MSNSLESFASDFNSAASHGLYNTIDVFIESMLYGFLTVATFFAVKLLRKQTTSRTRFLSSIIIIQWIVKTIASFGGLTWICLYYAKTRYVIENGELVRQVNPVIKGIRGMLNVADQLFWVLNEILALAVVIWRAYSLDDLPASPVYRVLKYRLGVQFALAIKSFIWEHQGVITSETIHGSMTNIITIVKSLLGLSTCLVATILVARRAM